MGNDILSRVLEEAKALSLSKQAIPDECIKIEPCIEKVCTDAGLKSDINGAPSGFWSQHSAALSNIAKTGNQIPTATLNYATVKLFQKDFCRQPPTMRSPSHMRATEPVPATSSCSRMTNMATSSTLKHVVIGVTGIAAIAAIRLSTVLRPTMAPAANGWIEGIYLWMNIQPSHPTFIHNSFRDFPGT